jgi:phenylalanyl-tRNA synthetase beta chain
MLYPISWIKEFVDIDLPLPDLAHVLTMAGLEVEEIHYVGLPLPPEGPHETTISGIEWDRTKIIVGAIKEVMPHPNADRLVLCTLDDGTREQTVLTGAPNLFEFKGEGPLKRPLKVAYAREGSRLYDGHQAGQVLVTLKRTTIRGVESSSMACSEKELGISEDHAGIILLDEEAPVGMPLVDYMGDAVVSVSLLPSFARCASMLGLAREIAALTGKALRPLEEPAQPTGPQIKAKIEITRPELNPRFVLGLMRDVEIRPSPYQVQRRLKLAGMRPINNLVDVTNYAMLEVGEPLHAFDYDVLARRAAGKQVKLITRTARPGETLKTLDGVERKLDESTVLVCDTAGALSIAGVMGGAESEVYDASEEAHGPTLSTRKSTTNVLLEGAAWNFINIRKTVRAQNLPSEAAYRFSRGVHPAMAERGVRRALDLMQRWSGGKVARGLVDVYPLPPEDPTVEVNEADVKRWLGIKLSAKNMAELLARLDFSVEVRGRTVRAKCPDHRLDISTGVTGKADLIEEIARVYGYDRIPESQMSDTMPPLFGNPLLEREELVRDLLTRLGLQEVISYRFTEPGREARQFIPGEEDRGPYVRLANPIASDKAVLRRHLLTSLLDAAERNARQRARLALFEIGPVFHPQEDGALPLEPQHLSILLAGARSQPAWQGGNTGPFDFYDLKGILSALLEGLHMPEVRFEAGKHPSFHPGKCARLLSGEKEFGVCGELHPLVRGNYDWGAGYARIPVLAAEVDLDFLLELVPARFESTPPPQFPPVLEDLAVVVDEALPAGKVAELMRQTGGKVLTEVRLFDVYRGEKIGAGKKSLAYSLTYQAPDKTLSDKDVAGIRARILHKLEQELGAVLRQ